MDPTVRSGYKFGQVGTAAGQNFRLTLNAGEEYCLFQMDWWEPRNFRDWLWRVIALHPLVLALLVLLLAVSELRFDWIERILGAYLTTTNSSRPEIGLIWDADRETQGAQDSLRQLVTDRQASQRQAQQAGELVQIAEVVFQGQDTMISPDHFRALYAKLPSRIANQLIPPLELLKIWAEQQWDRTYFRGYGGQLVVYLVDDQNHVLRELQIPADVLFQINQREQILDGSLEERNLLDYHIYPAYHFFEALSSLPEEIRAEIVAEPEQLLQVEGRVTRVGVSGRSESGRVEIAIELENNGRRQLIITSGSDFAVAQLQALLAGDAPNQLPPTFPDNPQRVQ